MIPAYIKAEKKHNRSFRFATFAQLLTDGIDKDGNKAYSTYTDGFQGKVRSAPSERTGEAFARKDCV